MEKLPGYSGKTKGAFWGTFVISIVAISAAVQNGSAELMLKPSFDLCLTPLTVSFMGKYSEY